MTKINERVIETIIMEYAAGEKPTDLSRKYGVAKSSVYRWLNTRTERDVKAITHLSQRDFHLMLVELERLRTDLEVYRACRCSKFSPRREKYEEIKRLKDRFNIHALCRVLEVNRSSFYHYLFRSPAKTQIEIDDAFFAPKIKNIFEQSRISSDSRIYDQMVGKSSVMVPDIQFNHRLGHVQMNYCIRIVPHDKTPARFMFDVTLAVFPFENTDFRPRIDRKIAVEMSCQNQIRFRQQPQQ